MRPPHLAGRRGTSPHLKPSGEGGFEGISWRVWYVPLGNRGGQELVPDTHLRNVKQDVKAWLTGWRRQGEARLHWASLHIHQPSRVRWRLGSLWAKWTQEECRQEGSLSYTEHQSSPKRIRNNHRKSSKVLPAPTLSPSSCFIPRAAKGSLVTWMRQKSCAKRGKEKTTSCFCPYFAEAQAGEMEECLL